MLQYMQISDMMQEFLCLSDQKKLIEKDSERLRELRENQLDYHCLKTYCETIVDKCIDINKGLGRFRLGVGTLDLQYLDQRLKLIQSHADVYAR